MTRADDLRAIRDHLETALYLALGLPVSPHQQILEYDLRKAHADWVRCYEASEARARKADR